MILTAVLFVTVFAEATPEVSWQRVSMSGQPIGYVRREIKPEGRNTKCIEDVLVVFHDPKSGKDLRQEQHGEYQFGADLAPVQFQRVTKMATDGGDVVRKVSAHAADGRLEVTDALPQRVTSSTLSMEQGLVSPRAEAFLFCTLEEGKPREFLLLDANLLKTSRMTVTRTGTQETKEGTAWVVEEKSEALPSLVTTIVCLPPTKECPNAREVSRVERDSKGRIPETLYEACSAEEAQEWMKAHEH